MSVRILFAVLFMGPAAAGAQHHEHHDSAGLDLAGYEDYRTPVGTIDDGVLRLTLEARPAAWQPWGEDGPAILAHVFAADGDVPRVPAPLIRFTAGTPVHVTVRNEFSDTLIVRGLRDHGGGIPGPQGIIADEVRIAPASVADVRFTASVPGTFVYSGLAGPAAHAVRPPIPGADEGNRAFFGLMVVDPPEAPVLPDERLFLITHWGDREMPATFLPATRFFINGRSWPHTERLTYEQNETVRWRVVNMSGRIHPMHLHGFYFSVDARGNVFQEQVFPPEERRLAVTEMLAPTETMRISWVPTEPGNWIFHCHFMRHMSWLQTAPIDGRPLSHHDGHATATGEELMGGLVLGVTVLPADDYAPSADIPRRQLQLYINKKDRVFGDAPAYAFVLKEGPEPPAADSMRFPGSPIILTRGEPTEIVVRNQADVPLGVHWHGLELESWADGVAGWSGAPGSVIPAVPPGESFAVRMTPPRAGTFMYHVHSEPGHQLAQGLYGPFLVMEEGETWDPETDRVFLLGSLGAVEDAPAVINGEPDPAPIELRAGQRYRLRFMHVSPDDSKKVSLLQGEEPVDWQALAKDGADLPAAQRRVLPADFRIHVGETYDFLWTPAESGDYTLRVLTVFDQGVAAFPREAPPPHTQDVEVRVR